MNLQPTTPMNKTQMNMYSTLTPMGVSLRRGQYSNASRTSKYRYTNPKRDFTPQIANLSGAISNEYRTQTKFALPNLKKQKGFMLQQWLNDALQGDQGQGIKEPLRTLKKYEMDKGSLKNANLNNEQISSLYNGLFVYTSGIKNIFEEMFKSASLQNRDDHKIEKTYWRMFIKLLENTTPVKICFQIIEDEYRREIANLKRNVVEEHHKDDLVHEDYEQKIRRLKKDIEEGQKKFKESQKDFQVMTANLILYEESFNEEVALRLKFEEKINQVYTSHDELKEKYETVRIELSYKSDQLMQALAQKYLLQNKVTDQLIKNQDILQRLELAQRRLSQRGQEIAVKNQEICDIKLENHSVEQKKKLEEIALDQLMVTIKILKKNQVQHDNKIEEMKKTLASNENIMQKLKETLSNAREKNDELYIKYHDAILKNSQIEEKRVKVAYDLEDGKGQILKLENKLSLKHAQKEEATSKLTKLEVEMCSKNKEINDKNRAIEKFDQNLTEMKVTKDRYERLNELLKQENQKIKEELTSRAKQLGQYKAKCFDLKFEQEKLQKMIMEQDIVIQSLKNSLQKKEVDIKEMDVVFKDKLAQIEFKFIEKEYQFNEKKKELSKINEVVSKRDGQKLYKLEEITYLQKQNAFLEKQLIERKEKIGEMLQQQQKKYLDLSHLKKKLEGKQFILHQKRQEIDGQIGNLKQTIAKLKKIIEARRQYIHPMILEDKKSQIDEMVNKIEAINFKNRRINETYDSLIQELELTKSKLAAQTQEKEKGKRSYEMLMKEIAKNKQQAYIIKLQQDKKDKQKQEMIKSLRDQYKQRESELHNSIDQKEEKIEELNRVNDGLMAEVKGYKEIEKELQNRKKDMISEEVQGNEADIKSANSLGKTSLNASTQTEGNQQSQIIPNSKKLTSSLRISQRTVEKQEKTIQKFSQRLYDSIIDKRQVETLIKVPIPKLVNNDPPTITEDEKEEYLDNERRQDKPQRKIQGKQFKKALRISYMRR